MKCPLTFETTSDNYSNLYINGADCLKEECAWWHEGLEACSVYLMQEHLAMLFGVLTYIEDKMPCEKKGA